MPEYAKRQSYHLHKENQSLKEQLQAHAGAIQSLEHELRHLNNQYSSIDFAAVRQAQHKAFQNVEDPDWMQDADDDIYSEIEDLVEATKSWDRAFARKGALDQSAVSEENKGRLRDAFERISVLTRAPDAHKMLGNKESSVLLTAMVQHHLFLMVSENALFFDPSSPYRTDITDLASDGRSSILQKAYDEMKFG